MKPTTLLKHFISLGINTSRKLKEQTNTNSYKTLQKIVENQRLLKVTN
jgi:hypothetical protein